MHEGHRKRMTERILRDPSGLETHELIELALYYALPRINTNPIGHDLITAFGSAEGVLNATADQLLSVKGVGPSAAALLLAIGQLHRRAADEAPAQPDRPRLRNAAEFIGYAGGRLAGISSEVVELYLLDKADHVICIKQYTSFKENMVDLDAREIMRFIAAQHPSSVAVAHNHPHGPGFPSDEDNLFTANLLVLCTIQGIPLCDHIIVGKDGCYSYYLSGLLEKMRVGCDIKKILKEMK